MQTYVAFLRGVSPMNLGMPALKRALERAGFADVRTALSSGNVVFATTAQKLESLERKIEAAVAHEVGKAFMTFVRPVDMLAQMLAADPFAKSRITKDEKRVVTFLRAPNSASKVKLPIEQDGVRILSAREQEIFTAYVRHPRGPVFMTLLEKTFGKEITTRTLDTVARCVR